MTTQPALLDHNEVFGRFVRPLLKPEELVGRQFPTTYPDMIKSYKPGTTASAILGIPQQAFDGFRARADGLVEWQREMSRKLGLPAAEVEGGAGEFLEWVEALDRFWGEQQIASLYVDPSSNGSPLYNQVLGFGAVLGTALLKLVQGEWLPESPNIDSAVLHPTSGHEVFPFHWAIKKFSSYGVNDGFGGKLLATRGILEPR